MPPGRFKGLLDLDFVCRDVIISMFDNFWLGQAFWYLWHLVLLQSNVVRKRYTVFRFQHQLLQFHNQFELLCLVKVK